jgi:hypothetical protein
MSYTDVVFFNRVGRTVDRDALEKQRIDDRGIHTSIVVGFEARFQTTGNLIFQPQRDSPLFIDDMVSSIQINRGSARTMTLMTGWSDNNNETKWIIFMRNARKREYKWMRNVGINMKKTMKRLNKNVNIIKRC